MMPVIYGNDANLQLIRSMAGQDHLPHACLFHGEKGRGRRTLALYFAMAALCTAAHAPCGECLSCRKLQSGIHPDLIEVEHSGKKLGFSVDTIRAICRDAIVVPNDGARKVYLFTDCDNMDIRAQNTLLKLTEEPPAHVVLLFTAAHPNVFLETMVSRMVPFAVRPCTVQECRDALLASGIAPEDAQLAADACGGNIGRAQEWLRSGSMQEMTRDIAALTAAVNQRSGYEILRILSRYEKDRHAALEFVRLLDLQLRDALVQKYAPGNRIGCDAATAAALSKSLTAGRSARLHRALQDTCDALHANVSPKLALAALGGCLL